MKHVLIFLLVLSCGKASTSANAADLLPLMKPPGTGLFLGDSIANGMYFSGALAAKFNAEFTNSAVPGVQTSYVVSLMPVTTRYDVTVLIVGTNNIKASTPLESVEADLRSIYAGVASQPRVVIFNVPHLYVTNPPTYPTLTFSDAQEQEIVDLNAWLAANVPSNAVLVDTYTWSTLHPELLWDGIHPTPGVGYQSLADYF